MSNASHVIFDRELLLRRRDRHAAHAKAHDFLLRHAAEDIVDRLTLVRRTFPVAVVLGAGHGVLSEAIGALSGIGLVVSADPSARALETAGGLRVVADEEALPFGAGILDLVVSALSLQLVNDLPGALVQIRRALKPDGLFLGAMLGGATLYELREALVVAETETTGGASPRVAPFADVRDLGGLLQRAGFALPVADSDTVEVGYASALDLMRELKGMGWSNMLVERSRRPLGRVTLMRAAEIYAERYGRPDGRVKATFEIVTLTGWVPHESQQKPLRPGSATSRLADALGVDERRTGGDTDGT
ncbi:MAG: methyltransferase domain-containing protein [Hyphomicrobiaceae bacterium]|nr:methyltransferase domain-containing protein [Hyphomicrobiaceae bacterium]